MYDSNPTLLDIKKVIDPRKQGQAFMSDFEEKPDGKKFYIESYGCQMNFSDSEIVASILGKEGYSAYSKF